MPVSTECGWELRFGPSACACADLAKAKREQTQISQIAKELAEHGRKFDLERAGQAADRIEELKSLVLKERHGNED